jgi:hypothetical protein
MALLAQPFSVVGKSIDPFESDVLVAGRIWRK